MCVCAYYICVLVAYLIFLLKLKIIPILERNLIG